MGQTVEVGFHHKLMNGMKQIEEGTLAGCNNGAVTLEVNGGNHCIRTKDIAAVRLAVEI